MIDGKNIEQQKEKVFRRVFLFLMLWPLVALIIIFLLGQTTNACLFWCSSNSNGSSGLLALLLWALTLYVGPISFIIGLIALLGSSSKVNNIKIFGIGLGKLLASIVIAILFLVLTYNLYFT